MVFVQHAANPAEAGSPEQIPLQSVAWMRWWHTLTLAEIQNGRRDLKARQGHGKPSWVFLLLLVCWFVRCDYMIQQACKDFAFLSRFRDSLLGIRGSASVTNVACRIAFFDQSCKICITTYTLSFCRLNTVSTHHGQVQDIKLIIPTF